VRVYVSHALAISLLVILHVGGNSFFPVPEGVFCFATDQPLVPDCAGWSFKTLADPTVCSIWRARCVWSSNVGSEPAEKVLWSLCVSVSMCVVCFK
jgi:hypothetical protein